jgi:multimeric flavodoxin WrbA
MPKVRIVGISSSPRHANTELLVKEALAAAEAKYGASTELISFKGKRLSGCLDCKACERRREENPAEQCVMDDDWQELITPLVDPVPDGLIIGSPVYFANVNAQLRAFMERCTSLFKPFWHAEIPHTPPDFSRTAAGAVSIGFHRHGGQEVAVNTILQWLLICGFVVVGSCDPEHGPVGYLGGEAWQDATGVSSKDSVLKDDWGLLSARIVGERVAETALLLANGRKAIGE